MIDLSERMMFQRQDQNGLREPVGKHRAEEGRRYPGGEIFRKSQGPLSEVNKTLLLAPNADFNQIFIHLLLPSFYACNFQWKFQIGVLIGGIGSDTSHPWNSPEDIPSINNGLYRQNLIHDLYFSSR